MKRFQDIDSDSQPKTGRKYAQSKPPLVSVYRVGELFRRDRHRWPEGAQLTYSAGGLELTLFHRQIRQDIVTDVRRGPAEFALIVDLPVIILAYRFGESIPWNDVPYSWHLQPVEWRVVPSLNQSSEARVLLWISLIGGDDGIIHAQRGMTLSPAFTVALHQAVRAQSMMDFDPKNCTSALSRVYLDHSEIADRLSLAVARTMGNE
jgi:hypothetical protein